MSAPFPVDEERLVGRAIDAETWARMRREAGFPPMPESQLFHAYQQKLLTTTAVNRVTVYEKSRRIGVTWPAAYDAVTMAGRKRSAKGMNVFYIGYNLEMAREFIDTCATFATGLEEIVGKIGDTSEYLFEDAKGRDVKAFRIDFASGFSIRALPSRPRSLRGMQGYVIIDEAAFHEDLPALLKAARALLIRRGKLLIISTHDGVENPFNELVEEIRARRLKYALLRTDFDQALMDGLYERICQQDGEPWSPEKEGQWRAELLDDFAGDADEELYVIPAEGSGRWLSAALIEARMTSDAPILRYELPADFLHWPLLAQVAEKVRILSEIRAAVRRFNPELQHALGFDFGRVGDLSVLVVFEITATLQRRAVLTIEMRRFPHGEQQSVCEAVIRGMPRPTGCAFDATGEGNGVAEAMQRIFGVYDYKSKDPQTGLVAAIKLTTEWYRTEMPPLRAAFEDGTIAISRDAEHREDLRLIRIVRGIPQVPSVRTGEEGKKRHADAAVAIALARYASDLNATVIDYEAIPTVQGRFEDPAVGDDDDMPFRMSSARNQRGTW